MIAVLHSVAWRCGPRPHELARRGLRSHCAIVRNMVSRTGHCCGWEGLTRVHLTQRDERCDGAPHRVSCPAASTRRRWADSEDCLTSWICWLAGRPRGALDGTQLPGAYGRSAHLSPRSDPPRRFTPAASGCGHRTPNYAWNFAGVDDWFRRRWRCSRSAQAGSRGARMSRSRRS